MVKGYLLLQLLCWLWLFPCEQDNARGNHSLAYPPSLAQTSAGVSTKQLGRWINYTNGNEITSLAMADGFVWAGTTGGVVRWSRTEGSHITYTTADGLGSTEISDIAVDKAGHVWAGTGHSISRFDGQTWHSYTTVDGLVDNNVRAIAIDQAGNKWFGTFDHGVTRFNGQTWTTYTTTEGLVNNQIEAITVDGQGRLWFATRGGVSQFDPNPSP